MDDLIDIELRAPAEVARRAVIVSAVLQRVSLEEIADKIDDGAQGEAFDLREWIIAERLSDSLSPREARLLRAPLGTIPREDRLEVSWQSEALATLLWSLGVKELLAPGVELTPAALLDMVPHPWNTVTSWVEQAHLRPESEIATARELADIWRWRLGAELTRRTASSRDKRAHMRAIQDVLEEAMAARHPVDRESGDFVVFNRPVRDLGQQELERLAAYSEERLRALNWISGFGSSWDDVPLEV